MLERPMWDIYKSPIVLNDYYFVTKEGKVSFDNICRHVQDKFNDERVEMITDDYDLIQYISNRYFYDCIKYENINHEFWI